MRMFILVVFGASLEELQEKYGVGPTSRFFSRVGVVGAGHVWHDMLVELVDFLEWSSPKHTLNSRITDNRLKQV